MMPVQVHYILTLLNKKKGKNKNNNKLQTQTEQFTSMTIGGQSRAILHVLKQNMNIIRYLGIKAADLFIVTSFSISEMQVKATISV